MRRAIAAFVLLLGCTPSATPPPPEPATAAAPSGTPHQLLTLGLARLHTGDTEDAAAAFAELARVAPDDGVAAYNLALTQYRAADLDSARASLAAIPPSDDARVRAGVARLRARLAYEDGDAVAERAALRTALDEDPADVGAAWALIRSAADPIERSALLTAALGSAPHSAPIAAEFGLSAAASPSTRAGGLAVLATLLPLTDDPRAEQLLHAATPAALQGFVNLVRASPGYRAAGEELESRLAPGPVVSFTTWRFRERSAFPGLQLGTTSRPAWQEGPVLDAAWIRDAGSGDGPAPAPLLAVLGRDALQIGDISASPPSEVAITGRAVVPVDLDADPLSELVLRTDVGLTVLDRDSEGRWGDASIDAPGLAWLLPVDLDHDGDADLLAGDADGRRWLFQNAEGLGAPIPADLPAAPPTRVAAAIDIDGDRDLDLVLGGDASLDILLNQRLGVWTTGPSIPLPGPARALVAIDASGTGQLGVAALTDVGVLFVAGGPIPAIDPVATGCLAPLADLLAGVDLAVADLDLDGDPDLVLIGAPTATGNGVVVAENLGGSLFRIDGAATNAAIPALSGLLSGDHGGDEAPDLIGWTDAGLLLLTNRSEAARPFIDIDLRAPPTKSPADARGVRIEVVTGGRSQAFQPDAPTLTLAGTEPDFVTATWPNGITEYLFAPMSGQTHRIELVIVLEGSCPFLYVHDGERFRFVTDLLGVSPLGLQLAPGVFAPADADEYLALPAWTADDGRVQLRFTEELHEVTYLDAIALLAVDAPGDVASWSGEKWTMPPVKGFDLRFTGPLVPPAGARDAAGKDVLDRVTDRDGVYLAPADSHPRYQGTGRAVLELDVPADVAASARPTLVLTGWLHWGNTSTNIALSQHPSFRPAFPMLEVGDGAGGWVTRLVSPGLPAGKTKPVLVDLTGHLDPADPRVRIAGDFAVAWDQAAFGVAREDVAHTITRVDAARADLRFGGFSKMVRTSPDAPQEFDYSKRRPWPWRPGSNGAEFPVAWQEVEGNRTAFGPVGELLATVDDRLVVFGDGEELVLEFDTTGLPPVPEGQRRRFFLFSHGWAKDGDPNVASAQTVLPLPFNAMPAYPATGSYPSTPALDAFRADTLTRWVSRHRLAERLAGRTD